MAEKQTGNVNKAVIHCDVDCFYCQVEVKDNPALANRPLAVHQGNSGGFVAVNYEVTYHRILVEWLQALTHNLRAQQQYLSEQNRAMTVGTNCWDPVR